MRRDARRVTSQSHDERPGFRINHVMIARAPDRFALTPWLFFCLHFHDLLQ